MSGKKKNGVFGSRTKKEGKSDSPQRDCSVQLDAGQRTLRYPATYCAPHIKVPGELTLSASFLVLFEPDHTNEHVREIGAANYQVCMEVRDILECGAVAMPFEASDGETMAYFIQLHIRTLDGIKFCAAEVVAGAWCVVFRMESREILHEVTLRLLEYLEVVKHESSLAGTTSQPRARSSTSVPFPCLDCVSEVEATLARQKQEQQAFEQKGRANSSSASRSIQVRQESDSGSDIGQEIVLQPRNVSSPLLTESLAVGLFEHLPAAVRIVGVVEWVLRYTPKAHGVSLGTLYRSVAGCERTLVLVQDTEDHVFGGYAPEAWEICPRFYGSGEAFVFSFGQLEKGLPAPLPKVYPWSCENSYFMHSDDSGIAMGGGNGSHALFLAENLLRGFSGPTETFRNPTLASAQEFVVKDFEIWAFEDV